MVVFEGINIMEENICWYGRISVMLWNLDEYGVRYVLSVRYIF